MRERPLKSRFNPRLRVAVVVRWSCYKFSFNI